MDPAFWRERWRKNEIAFHEQAVNPLLAQYLPATGVKPGARIFVPMCGKSVDIDWLLDHGFAVTGIELHDAAVQEVFMRRGITPHVRTRDRLICYHSEQLTLFGGDFFHLTPAEVGRVDVVYDRGALVALPAEMRPDYTRHLADLAQRARQILITYLYDPASPDGPPYAVGYDEITALYGLASELKLLGRLPISGGLARRFSGDECAWSLAPQR